MEGCTLHKGCCSVDAQRQSEHRHCPIKQSSNSRELPWQETAAASVKAPNLFLACNDAQKRKLVSRQGNLKRRGSALREYCLTWCCVSEAALPAA